MILLCDEDIGTGVPRALTLVGHDARSLVAQGWGGQPDVRWLARAGQLRWLVLSCNKKMLQVPQERETIEREQVGIVFLTTGQEIPANVLRLLLGKWRDLEFLDTREPRPFARFLSPRGRLTAAYKDFRL